MPDNKNKEIQGIIETLSPIERRILPFIKEDSKKIGEKSDLDETSVLRALRFLESKGVLKLSTDSKKVIDLGTNGIYYKKKGLPERNLLIVLDSNNHIALEQAKALSKLSDNEFKVSLGVLKNKALIELKNGKISLNATKQELSKKSLEEQFLELLPIEESKLAPEQRFALETLKKRKEIIELKEIKTTSYELTELGRKLTEKNVNINLDLIEELTPEIIKTWNKTKKFRRYDIHSKAPEIYGGKKHFVNQSIDYTRRIWTDLGFKEMTSTITQTSFWNFDALFTAQDHPVRELHDTFYLKDLKTKLPNKDLVKAVKDCHEKGVDGSKGWQYSWQEKDALRPVLRTHTTCLSAHTLATLKKSDIPAKFFSIGKCFRNETVDWSHGFEFYQTEGIVIDPNVTLRHLLGYLREFYKKMGFEKVRFAPSYFPYTEPSVEVAVWHPERKTWIELGGAGIFRPEITIPLMGIKVPVLAWGQGFDRIIMDYYKIKDLRELYSNDINKSRKMKVWVK